MWMGNVGWSIASTVACTRPSEPMPKKLTWSPQQTWLMPASAAWARNCLAVSGPRPSRLGGGNMPTLVAAERTDFVVSGIS